MLKHHAKRWRWLATVLLLLVAVVGWASPEPGTVLRNQAIMTYFDPLEAQVVTLRSNVAQVIVAEYIALTLDDDKQRLAAPGQWVNIEHRLTNVGNVFDTYQLVLENLSGDNWDLTNSEVYIDTNGNGLVDAGEQPVTQVPQLMPGESISLIVAGTVPSAATMGDVIDVRLTAISERDSQVMDLVNDRITVQDGAAIVLNKAASQSCSVPVQEGQVIEYALNFTNVGNANPQARDIIVNGTTERGVLIEDPLPGNSTLVANQTPSIAPRDGKALVHVAGNARDVWLPFEQWQGQTIDRIGVLIPADQMRPNQSGSFKFDVRVNENLTQGTYLFNKAYIDLNGNGLPSLESNQVCNLVDGTQNARIEFQRPTSAVLQGSGVPQFSNDNDFEDAPIYRLLPEQTHQVLQDGVYLRVTAAQLNLNPGRAEWARAHNGVNTDRRIYEATVVSQLTGDSVRVAVKETSENSGVFRSAFPLVLSSTRKGEGKLCPVNASPAFLDTYTNATTTEQAIALGCVLNARQEDRLDTYFTVPTFGPDGSVINETVVTDRAAVEPLGTVFDSSSGRPISGAQVALYQSRLPLQQSGVNSCSALPAGSYEPARDPITGQPLTVENTNTTAADNTQEEGRYQYPQAAPGYCYYLEVTPPAGYTFPSVLAPEAAQQYYRNITDSSYGLQGYNAQLQNKGAFLLDPTTGFVDIPLDPTAAQLDGKLVIDKNVETDRASIGDVLAYTIDITNNSDERLLAGRVIDRPAFGFRYIDNSGWLEADGQRINTPAPEKDPAGELTFTLARTTANGLQPFELLPGATVTLHYAMRLSAGAADSDGINRAIAMAKTNSGFTYTSNQDEAEVAIRNDGVLSDRAIIFGKVYVDTSCSNTQSQGEWPIGGVKLYLQDGTWVITDEDGQYSIFGRRPEMHTIKVDPLTLPEGLTLKPIDNRHAADGESRFVDLRPGEFHRADFATACPAPHEAETVQQQLVERNASISGDWLLDETVRFDPFNNSAQSNRRRQADGAGGLGQGIYTQTGSQDIDEAFEQLARERLQPVAPMETDAPATEHQMQETEAVAPTITRAQAEQGAWLWPTNGLSRDGRLQVVIPGGLTPTLYVNGEAVGSRHLGEQILNRRERAQVVTWYGVPMQEGQNMVEVKGMDPFGNERSSTTLEVIRPAAAHRLVLTPEGNTLPADGGRSTLPIRIELLDKNGQPARGDYFVTLENTRGVWLEEDLQPTTPGFQVRINNGSGKVHLRSTERTGPIELRAHAEEFSATAQVQQVAPLRPLLATGFIQGRYTDGRISSNSGPTSMDNLLEDGSEGRAAAFIKGTVLGEAHLTLAYDSDNDLDEGEEIRQDLNLSGDYPIAGDASVSGYDARSQSQLYLKLEKDRNSIMWGDYLTDNDSEFDDLGRIQRTLTGVNAVLENDTTRLQVFGARPEYEQLSEEIAGNGTAMLFKLSNRPRRGSERLERIVRDRNNPGLVVSAQTLRRNVDYSINYFTGDIRFFDVIPTFNADNNPVFIRASYELDDSESEEHTVLGARVRHQFTDELSVSLGHTYDDHEEEGYDITSATARYELDDRNSVYASIGTMTNREDDRQGTALSAGGVRIWEDGSTTELRAGRAEEGFRNSAAGISEAREELTFEHRQTVTPNFMANVEASHSNALDQDDRQTSLGLIGELQLGATRLRAGARGIEQDDEEGTERFTTGIVGVDRTLRIAGKPLTLGTEYEQALASADRRRIMADAELGLTETTSLYGRYELQNSLNGINQLNSDVESEQLTFGIRSSVTSNTDVFSEYRLNGAQDGRNTAAATGVRSYFEPEEGLTISPSFEWITAIDGVSSDESTAASLAVEDLRDANRRTVGRVETRFSDDRTYYGVSAANVWRINGDWSGVVRNDLRLQDFKQQDREGDNIVTLGLAQRPRLDNRLHGLYLYKWKEKWGGETESDSTVHIVSTHQNYQAHDNWILSGRLGGKWQTTDLGSLSVDTSAYVADGRLIWDINRRFDLDLHGGLLATEGGNELRYSYGLGFNALIRRNLRLGIGYNFTGFDDDDLDPQGYNAEGLYIGFDFKFDENNLDWLGSSAAGQRSFIGETQ